MPESTESIALLVAALVFLARGLLDIISKMTSGDSPPDVLTAMREMRTNDQLDEISRDIGKLRADIADWRTEG